jgi:hypothetical protein
MTPGIGLNTRAWIQEKTTVFTPMPAPSDRTITAASAGIRPIIRTACRRSPIYLARSPVNFMSPREVDR